MEKKASLLRTTVVVKDFERQVFFYSAAVNLELMKTIKVPSKRISAHPICASNPGSTMTLGFMQSGGQTMLGLMAFDCEVVYYSTSGRNNNSEFKRVNLDELLKTSDIISIHCPLNEQTENLLNYKNMKTMKDGAILLNLGRGGIINEDDLSVLIDEKEIYCGIDVVNKEPIEL